MVHSLRRLRAVLMFIMASGLTGAAQSRISEIHQLAGCFDVTYRFVEDGIRDIFSERYGLANPAKEWIGFQRAADDTFVLQHVLFAAGTSFPHWHEVWTRDRDRQTWTQEVRGGTYGATSQLRYRCAAPWTGNRWECHAGRAEKPIRDEKHDYDWLDRKNILLVTPNGWVQNEDNRKMRSSGDVVSHELGWITYARIADDRCEAAPSQFPKAVAAQP